MKYLRRVLVIAAIAALMGAGLIFFYLRPTLGLGKIPGPLGNFDAKTQSLISHSDRVVFLVPFSHWDTDWHQGFDGYSKLSDKNIQIAIEVAKMDSRFRFTLEQVLFVQHFWETHPASRADLVTLVRNRQITFAWGGITQPETSLVAPSIQVRNLKLGEAWIAQTIAACILLEKPFGNTRRRRARVGCLCFLPGCMGRYLSAQRTRCATCRITQ